MLKIFTTEYWIDGVQEHIRNAILIAAAAWLYRRLKPWSHFEVWNRPTAWIVVVEGVALVLLASSGYSPIFGRAFLDVPMSVVLAGFLYLSTGLGPIARLFALLPIALFGFVSARLWLIGQSYADIVYMIVVTYSIVVVTAINAMMIALVLSMVFLGTSHLKKYDQTMPLPLPSR